MNSPDIIRDLIGIAACIGLMLFAYRAGYKDGREEKLKNRKVCPMCRNPHFGVETVCESCSFDAKN